MAKRIILTAEGTINEFLNFVEEENNASDDDLEDLVGEDEDMEVKHDNNIEIGNDKSLENSDLEERQHEAGGSGKIKFRRKMLTYQKKVHNINLSLCEENYSPLEIVDQLKIIKSSLGVSE